jgi:hypothetical protein
LFSFESNSFGKCTISTNTLRKSIY